MPNNYLIISTISSRYFPQNPQSMLQSQSDQLSSKSHHSINDSYHSQQFCSPLHSIATLNQSITRNILQSYPIRSYTFIHALKSHPSTSHLIKFSSPHNWTSLTQALTQIHLKHAQSSSQATSNQPQKTSQALLQELLLLENTFRKQLLRILIKIEEITHFTWIPNMKLEHIRLHQKQKLYFVDAYSLMSALGSTNLQLSQISSVSSKDQVKCKNTGSNRRKICSKCSKRQKINQEGPICFTLSQEEFNQIYHQSVQKAKQLITQMFNLQIQKNQISQVLQEMNKNYFKIRLSGQQFNKNQPEYKANSNPKLSNPMTITQNHPKNITIPTNQPFERNPHINFSPDFASLVAQFITHLLISDLSGIQSKTTKTSIPKLSEQPSELLRMPQESSSTKLGLNEFVKCLAQISCREVLKQKEQTGAKPLELSRATVKAIHSFFSKDIKNIMAQIRIALSQEITEFLQSLGDQDFFSIKIMISKFLTKKDIPVPTVENEEDFETIQMQQSTYQLMEESQSETQINLEKCLRKLLKSIYDFMTQLKSQRQSQKEKKMENLGKKGETKNNKQSNRNQRQTLINDILLYNYLELSKQLHHQILGFSLEKETQKQIRCEECEFEKYQPSEKLCEKQQPSEKLCEKSAQSEDKKLFKTEEAIKSSDHINDSFEDLDQQQSKPEQIIEINPKQQNPKSQIEEKLQKPEIQQIKESDDSFSNLQESETQKSSFTEIQSSFSDLNNTSLAQEESFSQEPVANKELSNVAVFEQEQGAHNNLSYSQLNKAFLLSKTHISFDTVDLSMQREVHIDEITIDPSWINLNQSQAFENGEEKNIDKFIDIMQNGGHEGMKQEFMEILKQSGDSGRKLSQKLEDKQFTLQNVYKVTDPLVGEQSQNIHYHIKYGIHLSQLVQQILAQFSESKHKSLQKCYNIIRFVEISMISHLRNQLILSIDEQVKCILSEKEYEWEYLHKRSSDPKWVECQNKIQKSSKTAFGKIKNYVENIGKLVLFPNYENENPNVAKAKRLMEKYPSLIKLIFDLNSGEIDSTIFDIELVQKLYYWITKLIKEEYLNQLFLERALKRICAKFGLPVIEIRELLNPVNLKILLQKNHSIRSALNDFFTIIVEKIKIWGIITGLPYYSFATEKQNIQRKKNKKKSKPSSMDINQIMRNIDFFYIFKSQRVNTEYLEDKKRYSIEDFYKVVEVFLNMADVTGKFFESKEAKHQFISHESKQQQAKNEQKREESEKEDKEVTTNIEKNKRGQKCIHEDRVGILSNKQTEEVINPLIESVFSAGDKGKSKEKFCLSLELIQMMKKAVSLARSIKTVRVEEKGR